MGEVGRLFRAITERSGTFENGKITEPIPRTLSGTASELSSAHSLRARVLEVQQTVQAEFPAGWAESRRLDHHAWVLTMVCKKMTGAEYGYDSDVAL